MPSATSVFRLVPMRPGSHWGLSGSRGEVIVRARSTGEARALAAWSEAAASPYSDDGWASPFRDPRLYSVRRDNSGRFPAVGQPGLLWPSRRFRVCPAG